MKKTLIAFIAVVALAATAMTAFAGSWQAPPGIYANTAKSHAAPNDFQQPVSGAIAAPEGKAFLIKPGGGSGDVSTVLVGSFTKMSPKSGDGGDGTFAAALINGGGSGCIQAASPLGEPPGAAVYI